MIKTLLKTLLVIFSTAAAVTAAGGSVSIEVHSNAVVTGDMVYLGEIAEISGDPLKAERLKAISLGYAPSVGVVRSIPVRKIKLVIAATGLGNADFSLRSPETVFVRRAGQKVDPEMIRNAVETEIKRAFNPETVELKISLIEIPDLEDVPLGDIELRAALENVRNLFAQFYVPVEIRVSSKLERKLSVRVEINAEAEILVAREDIPLNTRINESMLVPERRRLEKPLADYLLPGGDNRGIRSSRAIRRGEAVTRESFVADIVVKNGDPVRIEGHSGRLVLAVNGIAQSSGRIGDRISVKNLQSDKLLQATVIDEGIVKILF